MSESKPGPSSTSLSGTERKAPNLFERAKEEFDAIFYNEKNRHHHHKETHGLRADIDANTSMSDVKAPNIFERAKEEIEAIVEAIHPKKESKSFDSRTCGETGGSAAKDLLKSEEAEAHSEKNVEAPMAKEESKFLKHKLYHHKETHGTSDDIDENTAISEVKGPSVLERAKEEIEALVATIHPKKDSGVAASSPKKDGGFPISFGRV